ncbi:MAG: CPBP family intramembrane glutamic endopeptidase [Duganella sp.]
MMPVGSPLSPARAVWLMTRLRLRRQVNQIGHAFTRKKKPAKAKARTANGGKRTGMWVVSLAVGLLMLFGGVNIARTTLLNLQCRLVEDACMQASAHDGQRFVFEAAADELHAAPFDPALLTAMSMVLTALFALAVLLPLAGKELAKPDWDLEWLVTMPVERSTLLWGRLMERSASNLSGIFALFPAYLAIAWYSGWHWAAVPIALLCTALMLPLAALLHTLLDTGLRLWLAASQLRNLQAVMSLLNAPLIYLVIALGMPAASSFVIDWTRSFPAWGVWLPTGVLLQVLQAPTLARGAVLAALLMAQIAVLLWGGVALMRVQLRHGVVGSGVRESGRKKTVTASSSLTWSSSAAGGRAPLSPVMRRELRLLSRDRNFLVQTLVLPLIMVLSQLVFNGKLDTIGQFGETPAVAAAIAFGLGVYVLMLSAFQTLNNEGTALWLLYTVPRSVESVLKEKARLWSVLALIYPMIIAAITAASAPQRTWQMLVLLLIVLAGIPIYSMIAVALGVFACDPAAIEVHKRIRPTYSYLFMLLASFYTWSIYTSVWSQKVVIMVLSAALALALWQKARDALPYLLDPAASPPARVSASDGLIAATAFFIVQAGLALLLMRGEPGVPPPQVMTAAFGASGLLVYAMMRFIYWRAKTTDVPVIVRGATPAGALRLAAAPCALACAVALAYLYALRRWQVDIPAEMIIPGGRIWFIALAVVAAPLCEEFIFRGLIFGGLRRSMPVWQAVAVSAAIFAVVHPPISMLPVFVVGLCTAWAYERSKTLLAPMLIHAGYNAVLVTAQYWL